MKNIGKGIVVSVLMLHSNIFMSSDFEQRKHRVLINHRAQEVVLAHDDMNHNVKSLAINCAQESMPEVWNIDALKDQDKPECWNLVIMRVLVGQQLIAFLYSPKTHYSFTLNWLSQDLQAYINQHEKKV